jgi:hypothetical protein
MPGLPLSPPEFPTPFLFKLSTGSYLSLSRAQLLLEFFAVLISMFFAHRFCSSGLMAVQNISNSIRNGEIEVGLAVGFESMSAT